MPGAEESSILFSLQGLMDRERERVDQEEEERLRMIEHENRTRLEREQRQQEEADRREREAHERALRHETERRAHEARLEAAKLAEIERVRLEAESRTRLEAAAMQQEHERRMATMELAAHVSRFRVLGVGGVAFGLVTLAVATGLYFGKLRPEQDRVEGAYARRVAAQRTRADDAQAVADRRKQQNKRLENELGATKQELADARGEIATLEKAEHPHRGGGRAVAVPRRATKPHGAKCTGDAYDPLNGCLQTHGANPE